MEGGYKRHVRKLPLSLDPPLPGCPIIIEETVDKLGGSYELILPEESARGYVVQLILGEVIGILKVFDIRSELLLLELLCRFSENVYAMSRQAVPREHLELVQETISVCGMTQNKVFPAADVAMTMIIDAHFNPVEEASEQLRMLWETYQRLIDVCRIWESSRLHVKDIALASELEDAIRQTANDSGISPMLDALAAGVPIDDVLGNRRTRWAI